MSIPEYDIGDDIRLTGTLTDSAGAGVDPTAEVIIVKKPDGTFVSYLTAFGFTDQGSWDASTNTPVLANGSGVAGSYYTVSVAGTTDFGDGSISFDVGDRVFYNGSAWRRIPNPSAVTLQKDSVGVYYIDQHATQSGRWHYRSEAIGNKAGDEDEFSVRSSEMS